MDMEIYAKNFLAYYAKGFYGELPPLRTYVDEKHEDIRYSVLQSSRHPKRVEIVSTGAAVWTDGAPVEIVIPVEKTVLEDEEGFRLVKELQRIFLEHVYHVNIFAYRMPFEPDIIPLPEEFKKRFGKTGLSISSPNGGLPVTIDLEGGDNVDTFIVCPLLLTEEQVKTYEDIRKDNERMAPNYLIYNLFDEVDCRVLK